MKELFPLFVKIWTLLMNLKPGNIVGMSCFNFTLYVPIIRASMIWILGEYCDRIDEVEEILGSFLEGFQDENSQVS